jgi:poly-beta-1,6-N-acetyl-D-glucosamine synthase
MQWLPAILILPYLFLLIRIFTGLRKICQFKVSEDPKTFLSVVVACRNEEKNIHFLLNDLEGQNYPTELFEVIIVDDHSSDRTADIVSSFNGLNNIRVIINNGKGKKQALRSGIIAARGDLILTTDADCRLKRNWVRTISGFYEKSGTDMIIAPVMTVPGNGFFSRFQELEFLSLQGITAGAAMMKEPVMCNGANLAFKKESYLSHSDNLHDEINSGDDVFLLHSLKEDSQTTILWIESPDALISTTPVSTLESFFKQRSRWISKSNHFKDWNTIVLGAVTFLAVVVQAVILFTAIINPSFIPVFIAIFILKSIPDYLILKNTSKRYAREYLMRWFLPSQLIYPFYVILVVFYSLIFRSGRLRIADF